MIEVEKNIFMTELALPNNPLKALNCFVIKDKDRNIIIDTGFNREDTRARFMAMVEELELKPEETILFLTHLHSDHTGLANDCIRMGMEVYISDIDGSLINQSLTKEDPMWVEVVKQGKMQGLDMHRMDIEKHPGFRFRPKEALTYTPAINGEKLVTGDYAFEFVFLPGHTPGLTALYEPHQGFLFSGDHILAKITPNITFWGFDFHDSLGTYLKSLELVEQMDVSRVFSSHRALIKDHKARIEELKHHHKARLEEALSILERYGESTVRTITKDMHWDIRSKNWEDFPQSQKWFAAGEAQAHLEHLRALGKVTMREENEILYYTPVK